MLDRDTLLVFGIFIPGLLGLVAIGVGGGLKQRAPGLWLWGVAMLIAGFNQALLLAMESSPVSIALANACFLAWIVTATAAIGLSAGAKPRVGWLVAWAFAAWLVFVACLAAGELRLGRLLGWPNIIAMLLLALHWMLRDRRTRMPLARSLVQAGLGLEAAAVTWRWTLVALGDDRAILMMDSTTLATEVFLIAAILGLVLATQGLLLLAMDDVSRKLRFTIDFDELTRLASRHAFFETTGAMRKGTRRALLMVDADHFKQINDRFGHAGGDAALRHLGELFRRSLPAGSLAGRLGGEEFAVLLTGEAAASGHAHAHAETLRRMVEETPCFADDGQLIALTVSVGVAIGTDDIDSLLRDADAALYRAKGSGRNRVV